MHEINVFKTITKHVKLRCRGRNNYFEKENERMIFFRLKKIKQRRCKNDFLSS